jgi:hypothetical protein
MVYVVQSYWDCSDFIHHLVCGRQKYHNVSETGSVSVLRWMGQDKPTQLGPLERASPVIETSPIALYYIVVTHHFCH